MEVMVNECCEMKMNAAPEYDNILAAMMKNAEDYQIFRTVFWNMQAVNAKAEIIIFLLHYNSMFDFSTPT